MFVCWSARNIKLLSTVQIVSVLFCTRNSVSVFWLQPENIMKIMNRYLSKGLVKNASKPQLLNVSINESTFS